MQTLNEYFALPDTPSPKSPVGLVMVKVLDKNPGMTFDDARTEANRLLDKAAGRFNYRLPTVLSPEEQEEQRTALRERFQEPTEQQAFQLA